MSGLRASPAAIAVVLAALAPLLAGCNEPDAAIAAVATQPNEPDVSIVTVKPQARAIVRELPGRIAPVRVADVRPRVSGIITERLFRQGSEVKEGDPLYRIDQRPFEVEVQASQAALTRRRRLMSAPCSRPGASLSSPRKRAAPEIENEKAIAAEKEAAADVEARKADLARAKLSLDYSTIRAPIDGIVGAAQLSEGALVVQNDTATLGDHPADRSCLCRLHRAGQRIDPAAPRLRGRRSRAHRARCHQGAPRARRRHALSDRRKTAVLRSQGRGQYRAGHLARRVRQSPARIAAGHVCPRPHRAGHRLRCHRRAAAGGAAQFRRRQRGLHRQGRQPRRAAADPHRRGAGRPVAGDRRPEGRRPRRGRRLSEVRRRRQGQAAGLCRGGGRPTTPRRRRQPRRSGKRPCRASSSTGRSSPGSSRCSSVWSARSRFRCCRSRNIRSSRRPRSRSRPVSGRLAGKPLQQRHAADRGGAQRRLRHPQFRIDQRLARSGRDHRQLRAGHGDHPRRRWKCRTA